MQLFSTTHNSFTKLLLSYLFFIGFVMAGLAQDYLPEKPKKETSLYDAASLLSSVEKANLEQKLINYADTTSTQIVVATITSLEGRDINLYASQWAHKWGIGQAEKDNGILLLVAKEDRKMAIQVGYGAEHLLTDAMSRRIIELVIAPYFKNEDYYLGLDAGTTSMMEVLSGEYVNDAESEKGFDFTFLIFLLIFIIIFIVLSKSNKNSSRGGGYKNTSSGPIILTGSGRSGGFGGGGFSGGGSSGGGFGGGFGGGGFGGGGASGGW